MYLPSILSQNSNIVLAILWGFLIKDFDSGACQIPPTLAHHIKPLTENEAVVKKVKEEFKLTQITFGKDTISLSRDPWWESKRPKKDIQVTDERYWRRAA